MKKIITYLIIITISVGLSVGITYQLNKQGFGATITTIATTDKIADFPAVYNADLASLNNAIHWTADADYLVASSTDDINFGMNTTTPFYNFAVNAATSTISSSAATSTIMYIYSFTSSKGGQIILEDSDGSGCSAIKILNGTIESYTITCPAE